MSELMRGGLKRVPSVAVWLGALALTGIGAAGGALLLKMALWFADASAELHRRGY
jgi:hypothetical protein